MIRFLKSMFLPIIIFLSSSNDLSLSFIFTIIVIYVDENPFHELVVFSITNSIFWFPLKTSFSHTCEPKKNGHLVYLASSIASLIQFTQTSKESLSCKINEQRYLNLLSLNLLCTLFIATSSIDYKCFSNTSRNPSN